MRWCHLLPKNKLSLSTQTFARVSVISHQSELKPQSPLDICMWPCKNSALSYSLGIHRYWMSGAQVAEERKVVMRRCCDHREHQPFKAQPRWLSKTEG